jgi:hypothetical protein
MGKAKFLPLFLNNQKKIIKKCLELRKYFLFSENVLVKRLKNKRNTKEAKEEKTKIRRRNALGRPNMPTGSVYSIPNTTGRARLQNHPQNPD